MRHALLNARTFASLRRHRNYRLYFVGQIVSLSGTWMQNIALAWLDRRADALPGRRRPARVRPLRRRSRSSRCRPECSPTASTTAGDDAHPGGFDGGLRRARRPRAQRATRRSGRSTSSLCSGARRRSSTRPNRHALTFQLVGRDELPNAVALNASLFNASRVVGPAIGGVVIAAAGVGACFALNAAQLPRRPGSARADAHARAVPARAPGSAADAQGVRQGLGYVWRTPSIRLVLLMTMVVSTVGFNFHVLVPVLASKTLHVGAEVFGALGARLRARRSRRCAARGHLRQGELEALRPRLRGLQHDAARARARDLGLADRGAPLPDRRLLHDVDREQPVDHPADRARITCAGACSRSTSSPSAASRRSAACSRAGCRTSAGRSSRSSSPGSPAWR